MGIFLTKVYFKYIMKEEIIPQKEYITFNSKNKTIIIENENIKNNESIHNPLFKYQKIVTNNHQISTNINLNKTLCIEVYKLNNIKSSIYIAYKNQENEVDILKYDFKIFEKVVKLNISPFSIKYFYEENENKENLIIQVLRGIHIYLIKNEKKYEFSFLYQEKGYISLGIGCREGFLPVSDFIIFRNTYEDKNYLIISFFYRQDCQSFCKNIQILRFYKNKLIKMKEVISQDSGINKKKLFLLWKDTKSELY